MTRSSPCCAPALPVWWRSELGGHVRILVIEDDGKVASFIQTGLEQEGYAVDVLNNGKTAGEQVPAEDYDAVLLDLLLPGRSGSQVLRAIRSRKPSLPVI